MQNSEFLTIGAMAQANGISPRTLRVYQDKGIIEPSYVNAETGFRHYDIRQSRIIDLVHELQGIGLSLDDIKSVIDSGDLVELQSRVKEQAALIAAQQRQLEASRKAAEEITSSIDAYQERLICDQIVLERNQSRRIATFELPRDLDFSIENTSINAAWETALRHIKKEFRRRGYPGVFFRNVASAIRLEDVKSGRHALSYAWVDAKEDRGFANTTSIPTGHVLAVYGTDPYDADGTNHAAGFLPRIKAYAQAKGLDLCGDFYQEVLCRWPYMFGKEHGVLYRAFIPVRLNPRPL